MKFVEKNQHRLFCIFEMAQAMLDKKKLKIFSDISTQTESDYFLTYLQVNMVKFIIQSVIKAIY